MKSIQSERSVAVKNPITLLIRLLYFAHSTGSTNSLQALQLAISFSIQQLLILHQEAFVLVVQPGHLSFLNLPQFPQYKPQAAIRFISLTGVVFMTLAVLVNDQIYFMTMTTLCQQNVKKSDFNK